MLGIREVHIDGAIFVCIAMMTFLGAHLGGDSAAKWIEPKALFWIQGCLGCFSNGLLALKMFRSSAYSKDKDEQRSKQIIADSDEKADTPKNGT